MNETGKESVEPPSPAPATPVSATPTPTNNESGNNRRGNRRGNLRRGNEGGTSGLEQKDFKGETPELNAVLGLITQVVPISSADLESVTFPVLFILKLK